MPLDCKNITTIKRHLQANSSLLMGDQIIGGSATKTGGAGLPTLDSVSIFSCTFLIAGLVPINFCKPVEVRWLFRSQASSWFVRFSARARWTSRSSR